MMAVGYSGSVSANHPPATSKPFCFWAGIRLIGTRRRRVTYFITSRCGRRTYVLYNTAAHPLMWLEFESTLLTNGQRGQIRDPVRFKKFIVTNLSLFSLGPTNHGSTRIRSHYLNKWPNKSWLKMKVDLVAFAADKSRKEVAIIFPPRHGSRFLVSNFLLINEKCQCWKYHSAFDFIGPNKVHLWKGHSDKNVDKIGLTDEKLVFNGAKQLSRIEKHTIMTKERFK